MNKSLIMTNAEYRAYPGIANSDLQLIENSPADYIWSKNAPQDPSKVAAFDFGTALHAALLEPEKFNDEVLVYSQTKTRETKAFHEFANEHKDSVILLESEYNKLRFMVDGAQYHPAVNRFLSAKSDKEGSIFVTDSNGIERKIRPDLDYVNHGSQILADVKTTANISDWRDSARWKNPLFTHGYGHTAAYYMDTASLFYGTEINEYTFIILQKTVEMGRYPVAAITITREECEILGFFDQMNRNLDKYAQCLSEDEWATVESFDDSIFGGDKTMVGFED